MKNQLADKQINPRFKIGMRNIKTALAVGVCVIFFQTLGFSDGLQAMVTSIICMKSSLQNSIQTGIERTMGTVIGAVLGTLALLLIQNIRYPILIPLVIIGVVLVIYLCNILKVQASVPVSLVVFIIIIIDYKGMPPMLYGAIRLFETIFGIIVSYLINRFLDPKIFRKLKKEEPIDIPKIRAAKPDDLARLMSIWLHSNLASHPSIDGFHWHMNYDATRNLYQDTAKIFVFEEDNQLQGFISILEDMTIDGLYVYIDKKDKDRETEIEDLLLQYCQELFPTLSVKVYANNGKTVEALLRAGFDILEETVNETTGAEQYDMVWSLKSGN